LTKVGGKIRLENLIFLPVRSFSIIVNPLLKTPSPTTKALGFGASLLAAVTVVGSARSAHAASFTFSFDNVDGTVNGTVSGTITLPDGDGTFSASSVTVTSAPTALGYTIPLDILANASAIFNNSFTVSGGKINAASSVFQAFLTEGETLSLNSSALGTKLVLKGGFSDEGVINSDNSTLVFSSATSVPEPSALLGFGLLGAGALVSRKRKA
jgi:hypothetical protein